MSESLAKTLVYKNHTVQIFEIDKSSFYCQLFNQADVCIGDAGGFPTLEAAELSTKKFISDKSSMESLEQQLKKIIRDIPDYPKPGIMFRDITPLLATPAIYHRVIAELTVGAYKGKMPDAIAGMESRGFLFGILLADHMGLPFIPIRKSGKLPFHKVAKTYNLEYGAATIEMHTDAVKPGQNILIHDDLLATAGTACATAELITEQGANVCGFSFIIELAGLKGRDKLNKYSDNITTLALYE